METTYRVRYHQGGGAVEVSRERPLSAEEIAALAPLGADRVIEQVGVRLIGPGLGGDEDLLSVDISKETKTEIRQAAHALCGEWLDSALVVPRMSAFGQSPVTVSLVD